MRLTGVVAHPALSSCRLRPTLWSPPPCLLRARALTGARLLCR